MEKVLYQINIYETLDYDKFIFADGEWNRNFKKHYDDSIQKNLKESIKKSGQITPILVARLGEKYLVLDGQHRFMALKTLGYPVIFQISKMTEKEVMEINSNTRLWSVIDAIKFYTYQGNENYINLSYFIDECTKLGFYESDAIKCTGFFSSSIKKGSINFSKSDIQKLLTVMIDLNQIMREGRVNKCQSVYRRALMMLLKNKKIKKERMIGKLDKYNAKIEHVTKQGEAYQVLEYIYNYGERKRVNFDMK